MNKRKMTENNTEFQDVRKLRKCTKESMTAQLKKMNTSRLNSWHWARDDFFDALEWLLDHQRSIRKGIYLSNTPGKEVWRYTLPKGLGSETIIYKYYDYDRLSLSERLGNSLALREVLNFTGLKKLGVPVAEVLACGENRHVGFLHGAYIISRYIPDSYDGSVLTPTGNLWESTRLRMGFCRKAVEYIARAHLCNFYHSSFRAHKILFPKKCEEVAPDLTFIDVANSSFNPQIPMKKAILLDLVKLFVDLRLSVAEIKALCEHYLQFNPNCNYNVNSIWDAMTCLKNH